MQKFKRSIIAFGLMSLGTCGSWAAESVSPPANRPKPDFATMKQEMIKRLSAELTCVQTAKDETALRSCRPRPPQGGPQGGPPPNGPGSDLPPTGY